MPPAPPPPAPPLPHKSVTFCSHCARPQLHSSDRDVRYYSDPGKQKPPPKKDKEQHYSTDSDQKYYSEPDAKYFEIDYEFLKELRRIARNNCPKCRRKRTRKTVEKDRRKSNEKDKQDRAKHTKSLDRPKYVKTKSKQIRSVSLKENYVLCNGRYHSDEEHCPLCCRICNRSTDTLDSIDDDYSLVSKSYSSGKIASSKLKSASKCNSARDSKSSTLSRERKNSPSASSTRERKNSIQSIKSVSFLESSNDESKEETNYTAKSFTNDLKKFLLRPSTPRLSFRDKFMNSFKQEIEATKKSPKLKAIKGLWKSY